MPRILAKITGKTLTAAAASLAMVGTAGAALGTSYSALEVTDTTSVETTVDTVAPDTTAPEVTVVETTVADTVVDTTLAESAPEGANGLCVAMKKGEERGRPKNTELKSFGRVAGAASAAGVGAGDYCDEVLAAKAAASADDDSDDDAVEDDDADDSDDDMETDDAETGDSEG
ncbi:MAG: hypothetical protein ACKO27_09075 [Ilumatobacteraceae bacterium]